MTDPYARRLAADWIETFGVEPVGPAETNPFQAFDAIVKGDPLYAWDLIKEVVSMDPNGRSWDVLSAAPLEDLLSFHGASIIDYMADDIEQSAQLQQLLRGVRKFQSSDEVWERVKELRGQA